MSFVLNEFSQIANIEPKLTTYWHNLEMSNVPTIKHTMYQHKVDVDVMTYSIQHIHINLTLIYCTFYCNANADQN